MRLKLILGALLIGLGLSSIKADTVTPNLGLTIPDVGSRGWGEKLNANFTILDSSGLATGADNIFTGFNTFASSVTWSAGNIILPTSTAGDGNIYMGTARIFMPNNSVYLGETTGGLLGQYQVCLGYNACVGNNATSTIGIGFNAASGNLGSSNIAIGENAMANAGGIGAGDNIAIGRSALANLTNPPVGLNIAIGSEALEANINGFEATVIGYQAAETVTFADETVALGIQALQRSHVTLHDTAIGSFALQNNCTPLEDGVSLGPYCGGNTAVGHSAGGGGDVPGLDANPFRAQYDTRHVGQSLFLGAQTSIASSSTFYTNAVAIGYQAKVGCSNCMVLGSSGGHNSSGVFIPTNMRVGIGLSSPTYALHINGETGIYNTYGLNVGSATIRNLAPNNCVQTDASGNLTGSGGLCGSGGGGSGGTPVEVLVNGVRVTSPTATLAFNSAFTGTLAGGATAAITLNSSSVTLQGNIFNGNNQLVKLNGSGQYPALDGSLITNVGGIAVISVYPATATASFPFGFSASTGVFASTTQDPVTITSSGSANALQINSGGLPSGGLQNGTGGALNITMTAVGEGLVVYSSVTDSQAGSSFVLIKNDAPGYNDPLIWIEDVGSGSNPAIRIDSYAPDIEMINESTATANGRGKWEPAAIAYQSARLQINSRSWDNTTFENVAYWEPLSIVGAGLYLKSQTLANDFDVLATSDTLGVNYFTQNNRTVGLTGPLNTTASWTFALPSTPNNANQLLYQANNGRGNNLNARQWEFTTGGTAGQVMTLSATSTPTWTTSNAALLNVAQTFTSSKTFSSPYDTTFTYGVSAGSFTTTGTGAGVFTATEGTAPGGAAGDDVLWGDSTANWFKFNPNNTQNYLVMGSSTTNTVGHAAVFSANGSLISGGVSGGSLLTSANTWSGSNTYTSSMTVRHAVLISSHVLISKTVSTIGDPLLTLGSVGLAGQVIFRDRAEATISANYGARIGNLHIGNGGTQLIVSPVDTFNYIDLYDQVLSSGVTIGVHGTGQDIIFKVASSGAEGARFSQTGGATISSSMTVKGAFGAYTNNTSTYSITASTSPNGPFTMAISTTNHVSFQVFTASPTIAAGGVGSSLSNGASDTAGNITVAAATLGVNMVFAKRFVNPPVCTVSTSNSAITSSIYSVNNSSVTFGFSGSMAGESVYYHCFGNND